VRRIPKERHGIKYVPDATALFIGGVFRLVMLLFLGEAGLM